MVCHIISVLVKTAPSKDVLWIKTALEVKMVPCLIICTHIIPTWLLCTYMEFRYAMQYAGTRKDNYDLQCARAFFYSTMWPIWVHRHNGYTTEGKSYEERLCCLKLWTLEEQRNRQDLIEVFKMCNGLSRLKLNEFFTLADNTREIRRHSRKLVKFRCIRERDGMNLL